MVKKEAKSFHTGTIKKTIMIKTTKQKAWRKISNIAGLSSWVISVRDAGYCSKKKKGIGAIRKITFDDGNIVEEHVVDWETGKYFTYVATNGLPLRAYVATISIKPKTKKSILVTWQSYLNSKKMSEKQFTEFVTSILSLYQISLKNLKGILEKNQQTIKR